LTVQYDGHKRTETTLDLSQKAEKGMDKELPARIEGKKKVSRYGSLNWTILRSICWTRWYERKDLLEPHPAKRGGWIKVEPNESVEFRVC